MTISGPGAEIQRLEGEAKRRGFWFRPLDLDFAFHSREMDVIREDLLESLEGLSSRRPVAKLVSTVTGEAVQEDLLDAGYWWRNIRSPVRFAEAAACLIADGYRVFLEIGPTAILQSYLTDALRTTKAEGRVLATLSRKPVDDDPFPSEMVEIEWAAIEGRTDDGRRGLAEQRVEVCPVGCALAGDEDGDQEQHHDHQRGPTFNRQGRREAQEDHHARINKADHRHPHASIGHESNGSEGEADKRVGNCLQPLPQREVRDEGLPGNGGRGIHLSERRWDSGVRRLRIL